MTLDEFQKLLPNIKDLELTEEYNGFKYFYCTDLQERYNINFTVDEDGEIVEFEVTTESWDYPEGSESYNSSIKLENEDIQYLPRAIEFLASPLDMTIDILEAYTRELKRFVAKFQICLEERDWWLDYESCLGSSSNKFSINPWFTYKHKYGGELGFTYSVWTGKLSCSWFDVDDVFELSVQEFRDLLYKYMKDHWLFKEDAEALEAAYKARVRRSRCKSQ